MECAESGSNETISLSNVSPPSLPGSVDTMDSSAPDIAVEPATPVLAGGRGQGEPKKRFRGLSLLGGTGDKQKEAAWSDEDLHTKGCLTVDQSILMMKRRSSRRLGKKPVERKSQLPPNSAWRQQRLKSIMVIPTPKTSIPIVAITGILFLIMGGLIIHTGNKTQLYSKDYTMCKSVNGLTGPDNLPVLCMNYTDQVDIPCVCEVEIMVEADMEYPVSLMYGMHNFYQNHRRYLRNRGDAQYRYRDNLFSFAGDPKSRCSEPNERDGKAIAPCGAIARTLFNDTLTLWKNGTLLPLSARATAIPGDALRKFQNPVPKNDLAAAFNGTIRPINWKFMGQDDISIASFGSADVGYGFENQDWIIWMRVAAFPNWKKLYRHVVEQPGDNGVMERGAYRVRILYNYPAVEMGATKQVHLQEGSSLGGKSRNLGTIYVATGAVLVTVAIGLVVLYYVKPRDMGDQAYLTS